ncbi:MAG: hypothetical protein WDZ79_01215 [Candidatus Paceibacterota bacterium]
MAPECDYSYHDLYAAAFGKDPEPGDLVALKNMPHPTRENVIRNWIERAGWISKEVRGEDGKVYTMFAPPGDTSSAMDDEDEELL